MKNHVAAVVSLLKAYSVAMANRAGQVVFGDPMKGMPIPGVEKEKIYTNCADTDPICAYLPIPLGAHLTYGSDSAGIRKTVEWTKNHMTTQSESAPAAESSAESSAEKPAAKPAAKPAGKLGGKFGGKLGGKKVVEVASAQFPDIL